LGKGVLRKIVCHVNKKNKKQIWRLLLPAPANRQPKLISCSTSMYIVGINSPIDILYYISSSQKESCHFYSYLYILSYSQLKKKIMAKTSTVHVCCAVYDSIHRTYLWCDARTPTGTQGLCVHGVLTYTKFTHKTKFSAFNNWQLVLPRVLISNGQICRHYFCNLTKT
jgi:hypothetical protein